MQEQTNKKPKSIFKIIGSIIFVVVMALLIIIIGCSIYTKKTGKQILPYSFLWILTESMEPTIEANSYILVKTADTSTLSVGDIITFVSHDQAISGSYNTHRIVEVVVEGKEFVTKGDNNVVQDTLHVYSEDIKYEYVCTLNLLTAFGRFYSTVGGLIITICVILAIIVLYILRTVKADKDDKSDDKFSQEEFDKLVAQEIERQKESNKDKQE